jgi:hypothetical protein
VPFGPAGDTLPARFTAQVDYTEHPLRVTFRASFDGTGRVKVSSVVVDRADGESVTPEDMTGLQLAQVVGIAVRDAIDYAPGVTSRVELFRQPGGPSDDDLRLLARLYWLAYVTWGQPRRDIMLAFDLPRSTANHWIRKAREWHELPGPHADEGTN